MLASVAGLAALLGWAEVIHWRASWRRLGQVDCIDGMEAVVVLGVRNRGDRANYLNRFRVRAGVRSMSPTARTSVLVLCGGAGAGHETEADLMARYARDELGYDGPIRLDRHSHSTWENIQNAIPLIKEAEVIKIVSNSLHAERGRGYLWKLRPDLAHRLQRGEDYRLTEMTMVKALLGLRNAWRQVGRDQRCQRAAEPSLLRDSECAASRPISGTTCEEPARSRSNDPV